MIEIRESDGLLRDREPITVGLPAPRGKFRPEQSFILEAQDGGVSPVQLAPSALWSDGSIRWCLLDSQISIGPHELRRFELKPSDTALEPASRIRTSRSADGWLVDCGTNAAATRVVVEPFAVVPALPGGTANDRGAQPFLSLCDSENRVHSALLGHSELETCGPLRTTLLCHGDCGAGLRFVARIHFFAGHDLAQVELTLVNPRTARHRGGCWDLGDPGSVVFRELSVRLPFPGEATRRRFSVDGGRSWVESAGDELRIYQDSSGGENWNSKNHVDRLGAVPHAFRGYDVTDSSGPIGKGLRADAVVSVADATGSGISAALSHFWQSFPSALELHDQHVAIALFPRGPSRLHELQGGEQTTRTVFLAWGTNPDTSGRCSRKLHAAISPEWSRETKVFRHQNDNLQRVDWRDLLDGVVRGERSFFDRRETIDEYGWRNFGDLYADHEAVRSDPGDPLIAHYNNQYDPIYGFLRQYSDSIDPLWLELATDLARHVRDIDIYHTQADRDEYNGGLFWHTDHYLDVASCTHRSFSRTHAETVEGAVGGGPGLEHCYTQGLLYHYFMTGEVASKEAVLTLADWVMRNLRGPSTLLGSLDYLRKELKARDGRRERYPFTRGTGNSINTLLDAYLATTECRYLETVEYVIRNCVGAQDPIEERRLLEAETNWSYTVCLQALGRYLELKQEIGAEDEMFVYARDTLVHYARWIAHNEVHYLDHPERLEFPTETWSAQDLRKSRVLFYASAHVADVDEAQALIEKGCVFFEEAMEQLRGFPSATLTRPLVLLLQNCEMYLEYKFGKRRVGIDRTAQAVASAEHRGTARGFFRAAVEQIVYALRNTSPAKEYRWLRSRARGMGS